MALTPDKTRIEHGLTIREKIIPWGALWTKTVVVGKTTYYKGNKYKADRLLSGGTGKVGGVTIHNTDGGANAETYTRATYPNQNMKDCRVHYYVDDKEAWQNLLETEVGWHAGDGRGNGNETTVSIEIIMRGAAIANDDASEDNGAKLAAILLVRHGLGIEKLYKHKDWSGKQCPLYIIPHWDAFKAKVAAYMEQIKSGAGTTEPDTSGYTKIAGAAVVTVEQMRAYITGINPDAPDLAALFMEEGNREGIRADVAFAQSCLETGNFRFGGDVKPEQNNYAGIGATGGGVAGNSFATPQLGIRAQIQHLKAYANTEALSGELIDPRFVYVKRGCAPYVEWLGIPDNPEGRGWASGTGYGAKILKILAAIIKTEAPAAEVPEAPVEPPAQELDNTPAEWEKEAVAAAISRGVIQGDTSGNLKLHSTATRAEVLVFLKRAGVL